MLNPEDFVKDQIALRYWPVFPTVLKTAYAAVEDSKKDVPYLQVKSAHENTGRLISLAVDFGVQRAIESGALNCDFRWREYARPTGHYLELRFSHSTASISQVTDPKRQPRNVVFRENARLNNQMILDIPELKDDLEISGVPHFLLVHGHQSLDFAHFGVPLATSKTKYSWLSQNLINIPHIIETSGPDTEDTDYDLDEMNLLKEDIDKWRKDHGDK